MDTVSVNGKENEKLVEGQKENQVEIGIGESFTVRRHVIESAHIHHFLMMNNPMCLKEVTMMMRMTTVRRILHQR